MTMISTTMGKNSLEEMEKSESEVAQSCPTLCDPMDCSLLHPWDFPGKNTGVDCHFLLQEIFLTQGLNPGVLHCRQTLYCLKHVRGVQLCGSLSILCHCLSLDWNEN